MFIHSRWLSGGFIGIHRFSQISNDFGFDAHGKDPLASINLVEKDFQIVTQKLKLIANKYSDGRIISMLEGGYDIQALEQSMLTHLGELQIK